ncbi:MAG: DnaB-like helicase C-terminal domain-containing protein [Thermodesulfobacteriota bacterium]
MPRRSSLEKELEKEDLAPAERFTINEYVNALYSEPIHNEAYVRSEFKDFIRHQKYLYTFRGFRDRLKKGQFDEIYSDIKEIHYSIVDDINTNSTVSSILDGCNDPEGIDEPILTLIPSIDGVVGGIYPGELGLVAMPTGTGKTTLLINFGVGAATAGKLVLHVSCETSEKVLRQRYASCITGMAYDEIRRNPTILRDQESVLRGCGDLIHIKEYPMNTATVNMIEGYIDSLEQRVGRRLDLLLVDYPDRMRPERRYKDLRHEIDNIFQGLSSLAKRRRLSIWTVSQTNVEATRGGYSVEGIGIEHLAESKAKAHISNIVLTVSQTRADFESNCIDILVVKNNERRAKESVTVGIDYGRMRIFEIGDSSDISDLSCQGGQKTCLN